MGLFSFNATPKKDLKAAPKKAVKTTASKSAKKPAAKKAVKEAAVTEKPAVVAAPKAVASSHAELAAKTLLGPRITEKASVLAEKHNAYAFNVAMSATKGDVMKAIKALYGVTPKKVAIVRTKGKKVVSRSRRQRGRTNANKKAYVYLKKGETIESV